MIFILIIQVRLFSLGGLLAIETSLHIQTCVWKSYSNLMDLILWYGGWINKIHVLIHILIYSINIYWPSHVSATAPDTEDITVSIIDNHPCFHWADILQVYSEEWDFHGRNLHSAPCPSLCQAVSDVVPIMATGDLPRPNYQGHSLDGVGHGLLFNFDPGTPRAEVLEAAWAVASPPTTYVSHHEDLIR